MSNLTVKRTIHLSKGRRGAHAIRSGKAPKPKHVPGPVPRQARLMAFAIVFDEWIASGEVADYAELSAITGLDRSRISQIMNMRLLSPTEQEARLQMMV